MDKVFDRVVDRTRDVPILRTLFGVKHRPGRNGTPDLSLKLAAVIETPRYDLTLFKVHFGNLTLKAYTKDLDASGAVNTRCVSRRSCTTPEHCAAGACWTTSRRSLASSPAWSTGSPPPWTASITRSSATICSTGSRPP